MKNFVSTLTVIALLLTINLNAQEKPAKEKATTKTEKTCTASEKKSCSTGEKKGGCCAAKKAAEKK
jgi:hypothetical protein